MTPLFSGRYRLDESNQIITHSQSIWENMSKHHTHHKEQEGGRSANTNMPLVNVTVGSIWLDFLNSQSSIHRQPKSKYSLRDEDNGKFILKNMDPCIDTNLKKKFKMCYKYDIWLNFQSFSPQEFVKYSHALLKLQYREHEWKVY